MKLSEKNLQLILVLLIVVIAFCAYRFGYMSFKNKADAVRLDNKLTQARIDELASKEAQREDYINTINGAGEQINDILEKYGAKNTKEKTVLFVNKIERDAVLSVPSVSLSEDEMIYSSSVVDEESIPVIRAYQNQVTIEYSCSYENMKKLFDVINTYAERKNVESFTMMYNQETDGVAGSMIINQYSVDDANHVYEIPAVTGVRLGKQNIFE